MKDFIKESLRLKLEAKSARDTSRNTGPTGTTPIARLYINELKAKINEAQGIYKKYPELKSVQKVVEFLKSENSNGICKPKSKNDQA